MKKVLFYQLLFLTVIVYINFQKLNFHFTKYNYAHASNMKLSKALQAKFDNSNYSLDSTIYGPGLYKSFYVYTWTTEGKKTGVLANKLFFKD